MLCNANLARFGDDLPLSNCDLPRSRSNLPRYLTERRWNSRSAFCAFKKCWDSVDADTTDRSCRSSSSDTGYKRNKTKTTKD